MPKQLKSPEGRQLVDQPEIRDLTRRDAMNAIARFSAYVAPATYVLLDSKSAFAQSCSGSTPGSGGTPPGQGGGSPGQGGNPPGQGGTPPGQC